MYIIFVLIIIGVLLASIIYNLIASQNLRTKQSIDEPSLNPENYFFRIIYYNLKDDRIFVPRRKGAGFTVNFANPLVILITIFLIGWLVIRLG